jgi:uncharacterized protein (TIGR02466 family)
MSEQVMYDITPFPPMVLKVNYDKFNLPKVMEFCERVTSQTKATGDTNWAGGEYAGELDIPHKNPIFKDFYNWLTPIVYDVIINKYGFSKDYEYKILNSWINLHVPGGNTPLHHHGPSVVAISTYLYMPENGGYIEFKNPLEYHNTFYPYPIDDEISNWKETKTKTGDVVMFPGWLRHRTQTNRSNENRWVLTTNYFCTNIPKGAIL